ncbi:MAG: RluA family pseudouridine synthase [Clostridia bacterium]|nr:RluA family pseudouridine synthase [Clostridia bacterium]
MAQFTYTVPTAYDGETMQTFLRRECGLSWRMVVKLKRVEGGMTADGRPLRSIDRLQAGQTVTIQMPEDAVKIEGADMPLSVAYEDDYLLVVDKPPYLAVHPSAGKPEPTLANGVVGYFEKKGTPLSFRPVNRLDRNTSGLLLAAKSSHVAYALAQKPQKVYLAILLGRLEGEGTIRQPIRVKEGCTITREVGEGGKDSITHWKSLATDGEISLVRVVIETGRTHQIRVHMSWLGYPLAGDTMYGTDETVLPRHGLHCARMELIHPVTAELLTLTCPMPQDMRALLEARGLWQEEWNTIE